MARILICHIAKDAQAARELGAALMARGNAVTFDGEPHAQRAGRAARLAQFEAVIVMWSDSSVASEPLAELAREALAPNLLVPVRVDEIPPARLPPLLRRLNSFAAGDITGICRNVARLAAAAASARELARAQTPARPETKAEPRAPTGLGAPPAPDPRDVPEAGAGLLARYDVPTPSASRPETDAEDASSPAASAASGADAAKFEELGQEAPDHQEPVEPDQDAAPVEKSIDREAALHALEMAAGHLMHLIAGEMWLGEAESVVIWLDGTGDQLDPVASSENEEGLLPIVESMTIELLADADTFDLLPLSNATQELGSGNNPARWEWQVMPRTSGTHSFCIRISGVTRDVAGRTCAPALADQELRVSVYPPAVGETPLWPKISSLWQRLRRTA